MPDDLLQKLPLDGRGADLVLLAQFRVNVALLSSDIQVAAQHQAALRRDVLLEAVEELQLGVEILAAVRHVDGSEAQIADVGLHHARLVIELGVRELRPGGKRRLAQVQRDARIPFEPMPEAPVFSEQSERFRDGFGRSLDLLKTEHVRLLGLDPLQDLGRPRPNAVHVPGRNLHGPPAYCRAS